MVFSLSFKEISFLYLLLGFLDHRKATEFGLHRCHNLACSAPTDIVLVDVSVSVPLSPLNLSDIFFKCSIKMYFTESITKDEKCQSFKTFLKTKQ